MNAATAAVGQSKFYWDLWNVGMYYHLYNQVSSSSKSQQEALRASAPLPANTCTRVLELVPRMETVTIVMTRCGLLGSCDVCFGT